MSYLWMFLLPPIIIWGGWFLCKKAKANRSNYLGRPLNYVYGSPANTGYMLTASSWWENQRVRKSRNG